MNTSNTRNLVKIISALGIGLMLTACATNSQNIATDARASLGKITDKQTIQQYEQRRTSPVDVSVGVGGGGGNIGGGISIGLPIGQANINRQITIDFVDENKKQLFWQAVSESSFNSKATPEKREALLNAIAEKVLLQYPPKQ